MRVLALVTEAYGGRGGIAQAARDLLAATAGHPAVSAVEVLPRHATAQPGLLQEKVAQLNAVPHRLLYTGLSMVRAVLTKPDLVLCNHLFMAPLAALAARATNAQLAIQVHGIEIWKPPSRAQRWALETADFVLCVSRDTRSRVLQYCDLPSERAIVLNNTVGSGFAPGDRAKARAKFGLRDELVLLTVGRLDPSERYKGHDRVIAAMRSLAQLNSRPLIYAIAGDGDDRGRLEALAQQEGAREHVLFLGRIADCELPDLYRAADLFVLPSTGEGFGIAFIEAMACGTPAIGLAVGGAPDALGDGALGACVAPSDFPDALAAALAACRQHRNDLPGRVQDRFGRGVFVRALAKHLDVLCARRQGASYHEWN